MIYFDHIVPIDVSANIIDGTFKGAKEEYLDIRQFMPTKMAKNQTFYNDLTEINFLTLLLAMKMKKGFDFETVASSHEVLREMPEKLYDQIDQYAPKRISKFWDKYSLNAYPLDCGGGLFAEGERLNSNPTLTLSNMRIIDPDRCSWNQLVEFKKDKKAKSKLRRLRLFAIENYAGKDEEYIKDDILLKIEEYEETVKKWGFETIEGAFNSIVTSKVLGGTLTAGLVATLFGAPTVAATSAIAGGVVELGRASFKITNQVFALRQIQRENPISFITYARDKLK